MNSLKNMMNLKDVDKVQVKSGNCYRTEEEAEKHINEWMSKVYGKDWRELLK